MTNKCADKREHGLRPGAVVDGGAVLAEAVCRRDIEAMGRAARRREPIRVELSAEDFARATEVARQVGTTVEVVVREAVTVMLNHVEMQPENIDLLAES